MAPSLLRGHPQPRLMSAVSVSAIMAALLPAGVLGQQCDGDAMTCTTVAGCIFDVGAGAAGACRAARCPDLDGNQDGCLGSPLGCQFTVGVGAGACHVAGGPVSCASYSERSDCPADRCRFEGSSCLDADTAPSCFR